MAKEELETKEKLKLLNMAKEWLRTEHREGNVQSLLNLILSFTEPKDKQIKELEKENAELKKKNLDTQDAVTMQMYTNKANKEIADKQLTKAKELLKQFLEAKNGEDTYKAEWEAEQFLQDCDIDNAIQQANKGLDFDKIADEMEQDLKDSEVEK